VRDKAAYFNEVDRDKAAWIRELQKAGVVADGEVDERSIEQVEPADLRGFTQCHFFAGIAVWSYALRLAGWPDSRPVWTGSCPCPSFSVAGEGKGFDDPRHLWPHWIRLIRQCRPSAVLGEQVDDAIAYGWLDLVQSDLEKEGYAVGKAVLNSRITCAEDERRRLYFMAHAGRERRERPLDYDSLSRSTTAALAKYGDSLPIGRAALDACLRCLPPRDGTTVSVERSLLRGYGDAINAETAKAFIEVASQVLSGS
jgi:DNA (cytosine-5)-methyltransferase 1